MRIYLNNKSADFYPDPTWKHDALGFLEDGRPKQKQDE